MCLYIKSRAKAKIAKQDIQCVKILLKENGGYKTPYYYADVVPGQRMESELVTDKMVTSDQRIVEEGIHSFIPTFKEQIAYELEWFDDREAIAVPCIIPKGSHYFVGNYMCEEDDDGYASDCIIYPETFEPCV